MFWMGAALAADIRVPDDAATLDDALSQATDGDQITLMKAGRYAVPVEIEHDLTLRGTAGVVLVAPIVAHADLTLRDLTVAAVTTPVAIDAENLVLTDVVVVGEGRQTTVINVTRGLTGDRVTLADLGATDIITAIEHGVDLDALTVRNLDARALIDAGTIKLFGADIRCSAFERVLEAGDEARLDGVLIAGTGFLSGVSSPAAGYLRNMTIAGKNGEGVAIALAGGDSMELRDLVIVDVGEGIAGSLGATIQPSRLFMRGVTLTGSDPEDGNFAAAITANTTLADPMLAPGGCDEGYWPIFGSPLVDTGEPSREDRDASPSDIGATGGPYGLDIVPDADGDRTSASRDCDDADAGIEPNKADRVGDGIDQDCDGLDGTDDDDDGHASIGSGGDDCDDGNPRRFPSNPDPFGDGVDTNCDGGDGLDADLDGARSIASGGDDCDDSDPTVHPGATEDDAATDLDCDGYGSPFFDTTLPTACDCDTGGGPPLAALLVLGLLRRRR